MSFIIEFGCICQVLRPMTGGGKEEGKGQTYTTTTADMTHDVTLIHRVTVRSDRRCRPNVGVCVKAATVRGNQVQHRKYPKYLCDRLCVITFAHPPRPNSKRVQMEFTEATPPSPTPSSGRWHGIIDPNHQTSPWLGILRTVAATPNGTHRHKLISPLDWPGPRRKNKNL